MAKPAAKTTKTAKTSKNTKKTTTSKASPAKNRSAAAKARVASAKTKATSVKSKAAQHATRVASKGPAKHAAGFMKFVREQGVIGLAVGLAIGAQAGATVKAIVESFINPIVAFLVGTQDGLLNSTWNIVGPNTATTEYWLTWGERTLVVGWGAILSSLITLVAVAAVIYYVVKGLKLDRLDKKKES